MPIKTTILALKTGLSYYAFIKIQSLLGRRRPGVPGY